ncbi:porin [Curvibacter sp. HBC61]|uniref:Porin n=1 Tax=Curvibacter cyanobacteriorum TaxID=3026422 RepID=A0ABT5MZ78_9BURK|nr:porin [Curvibacter sp. HBC61]MDD0838087.1 porin [Curvibacter sp. HBC61]
MKKSLIALASLSALCTLAQAQSSLVIYGLVDSGVRHDSAVAKTTAGTGSQTQFSSGVMNTSRLGFRGTEDLGGGLKANFNLETGINLGSGATSSTSNFFDRRAVMGLQDSWGRVDIGRNTTFLYDLQAGYVVDPLGHELTGNRQFAANAATAVNPLGTLVGSALNTSRRDNMVKYQSPTWSGTTLGLAYSFGNVAGATAANSSVQVMAKYDAKPLQLGVAYDRLRDTGARTQTTLTSGGNYTVNGYKFTGGYSQMQADPGFLNSNTSILTNSSSSTSLYRFLAGATARTTGLKATVVDLGLTFNATPMTEVVVAYYNTKYSADGVASNRYDTFATRARYKLSKRTDLYAAIDYTKAKGITAAQTASGTTSNTGFAVGVQHRF